MSLYNDIFIQTWKKTIKRAYIQMLILYTLFIEQNCTGYMITEQIRARLGDTFQLSAGTIYPQLKKLENHGLVSSETRVLPTAHIRPKEPRKIYDLTQEGYETTREVQNQWIELSSIANSYLEEIWNLEQEASS